MKFLAFLVVLLLLAGALLYAVSTYNRFQQLKNGAEATLNQIRVALKKRLDLLNELLEAVKSYGKFEKETLEKITRLRSSVLKSSSPTEIGKLEAESRAVLGNLLLTVESYPELKTSSLVKELTQAAKEVEEEIAQHRYTYNNVVQEFNTLADTFPSNLIASAFGFKKLLYLEIGEEVEKRPNLSW